MISDATHQKEEKEEELHISELERKRKKDEMDDYSMYHKHSLSCDSILIITVISRFLAKFPLLRATLSRLASSTSEVWYWDMKILALDFLSVSVIYQRKPRK